MIRPHDIDEISSKRIKTTICDHKIKLNKDVLVLIIDQLDPFYYYRFIRVDKWFNAFIKDRLKEIHYNRMIKYKINSPNQEKLMKTWDIGKEYNREVINGINDMNWEKLSWEIFAKDKEFIYQNKDLQWDWTVLTTVIDPKFVLANPYFKWDWYMITHKINKQFIMINHRIPWDWKKNTSRFDLQFIYEHQGYNWDWDQIKSRKDKRLLLMFPPEELECRKEKRFLFGF